MSDEPQVRRLRTPLEIRALESEWTSPPSVARKVDEIWADACARHGTSLTDGKLFSLVHEVGAVPDRALVGRFVRYRYSLAQRFDTTLRDVLQVRPLAVTAAVFCPDGLVVGKRPESVPVDGGLWEIVPAGGLEPDCLLPGGRVDPLIQLQKELREELGIASLDKSALEPLFLMTEREVTDLVFRLTVAMTGAQIRDLFGRQRSLEHTAIDFIAPARIRERLNDGEHAFSAGTRALLLALLAESGATR